MPVKVIDLFAGGHDEPSTMPEYNRHQWRYAPGLPEMRDNGEGVLPVPPQPTCPHTIIKNLTFPLYVGIVRSFTAIYGKQVPRRRFGLRTLRFSVACSTN
jgi:hypothetical protein